MMTIKQIRETLESTMTVAEAKAFEEEVGMSLEEFLDLAETNILYRDLVEVYLGEALKDKEVD